jgi:hypothetical protein
MNPEIEKLIDLALADGQITEKERHVILKKAAELGVDADEVEMTLDAKLHQLQATQSTPNKEKVGNIKTCPACGAEVKALKLKCDDCEHEFINNSSNSNLTQLEKKLASVKADDDEKRVKIITDHPISNDKETMFELLSYMSSKVLSANTESDSSVITAYHGRAIEIITKLSFVCGNDPLLMEQLNQISKKMASKKNKNVMGNIVKWSAFSILWCLFTYLMIATIARIFGAHWWPY